MATIDNTFSPQYVTLRHRLLRSFVHGGQVAEEVFSTAAENIENPSRVRFGDQTLYLGFALFVFSVEEAVLVASGAPATVISETQGILHELLKGYERCEQADQILYGQRVDGFFLRDAIDIHDLPETLAGLNVESDFSSQRYLNGDHHLPAMSVDQTVHLFMGWWAVCKYSSSPELRAKALLQMTTVFEYLADCRFVVDLPNGRLIPQDRGKDFRGIAGFLCRMMDRANSGGSSANSVSVDLSMEGDAVRVDLGGDVGFEVIPDWRIPASARVSLIHPLILRLEPVVEAILTGRADVTVSVSLDKLFPGSPHVTIPCVHLTTSHPEGDTVRTNCFHLTAEHPGGHSNYRPCEHLTTAHDHHDQWTPCTHLGPLHGRHRVAGVKVPCWHIGPQHSGGHTTRLPCLHPAVMHPGGHEEVLPCLHMVKAHPGGHEVKVPCVHMRPAHNPHSADLSATILPIKLGNHASPYARSLALIAMAFEPDINAGRFRAMAKGSNHEFSVLLRAMIEADPSFVTVESRDKCRAELLDTGHNACSNRSGSAVWCTRNRWMHCTSLHPSNNPVAVSYNGLDFMALEGAMRLLHLL